MIVTESLNNKFSLLDNLPVGIFVLKKDFVVLFWNSMLEEWSNISRDKIIGSNIFDSFPHLNKSLFISRIQEIFNGGPPAVFSSQLHKYIIPSYLPDGLMRIQHTTVIAVPSFSDTDYFGLFVVEDITDLSYQIKKYREMRDRALLEVKERKIAEKELKNAEAELRNYNINLEETVEKRTKKLNEALSNLKNMQSQFVQTEKMASIGQLAAGVAHEINNPTGFVSSNLNVLAGYDTDIKSLIERYRAIVSDLKAGAARSANEGRSSISEQLSYIAELEKEVDIDFILNDTPNLIKESQEGTDRIKKIVIDLKDFAHPGELKLNYADINKNMESTLNVVWNELKYKARVVKEYGDLPQVKCYSQQLNQVFVNLLVNAAQAIAKEGEIRISTRKIDDSVEIKISDTGAGIPKENLSKIFDPFFTTKEVGKGTGLGLNVAYNIIKKHNGTIDVESVVGKGTTFTIRIPVGSKIEDRQQPATSNEEL